MLNKFWEFLKGIWNSLNKIFIAIYNLFKNIVGWFRARIFRVRNKYPNAQPIALRIKSLKEQGEYSTMPLDLGLNSESTYIVNTFYDEATEEIISEETEIQETQNLDAETKARFGNNDMLVLTA
jgi:hypothetical protein